MKLFEFEGKELFGEAGIKVPKRVVVSEVDELEEIDLKFPVMVKAQVLSGKRGKRGLVKKADDEGEIKRLAREMLGKEIDGEKVEKVLVEEAVEIERELYVSVTYSTETRGPVLLFSDKGGMEVEETKGVEETPIEIRNTKYEIRNKLKKINTKYQNKLEEVVRKLIELFFDRDLFLAEINPLVITKKGEVMALDAKVVSDDAAEFRQKWDCSARNMLGREKTWAEIEAEKIDKSDHRGVVGRVYLDLEGDIGVLTAGGGASLVAMDAMVSGGLKPANYTEFSGNPPREKVKRLTEVVLNKKGLRGAILVGGKAGFTDQYETLFGFVEGLETIDPKYPIVVRRDGPRMEEAREMLRKAVKEHGWDLHVYGSEISMIEAVNKLRELVNKKGGDPATA